MRRNVCRAVSSMRRPCAPATTRLLPPKSNMETLQPQKEEQEEEEREEEGWKEEQEGQEELEEEEEEEEEDEEEEEVEEEELCHGCRGRMNIYKHAQTPCKQRPA